MFILELKYRSQVWVWKAVEKHLAPVRRQGRAAEVLGSGRWAVHMGPQASQDSPGRGGQGPASSHPCAASRPWETRSPGSGVPSTQLSQSPSSLEVPRELAPSPSASPFVLALLFPHPSTPVDDHAAVLPAPSPLLHFIVVSSLEHSTPLRPPSFCCAAEGLLQLTSRLAGSPRYLKCTFSPNTSFSFCCFSSRWLLVSYLGNAFHEKTGWEQRSTW